MPRPTKRGPEVAEVLLAALAEGKTRSEALAVAGLDDNTLYRWMKADTAFREAVAWAEVDGRFAASPILRVLEEAQRQRAEAEARSRERWERARAGDASCLIGASPEIVETLAEELMVAMGTHYVEYTRGKDGGWVRHVWRVPKSKRRPPVCGARTVKGTPCQARALPGKTRCKFHGGMSTGPKTEEGRAAIAVSNRRRKAERTEGEGVKGD
jgi:hypothetical protein